MHLQIVFALSFFIFFFELHKVMSTSFSWTDDQGHCRFSDEEDEFCASYCYKAVKGPLEYIIQLKEQIRLNEQRHMERNEEIKKLREQLINMDHIKGQNDELVKAVNHLSKTNEDLAKNQQQKNIAKINELKAKIAKIEEKHQNELNVLRDALERNDKKEKNESKDDPKAQNDNEIDKLKSQISSHHNETQNLSSDLRECEKRLPSTGCKGLSKGIHKIKIHGLDPFSALCIADIRGNGWIVVHERFDGSENFNRTWTDFGNGFGKLDGEFFIGLKQLHRITNTERYELTIQFGHYNESVDFANYDHFRIGNENEDYALKSLGQFKGTTINEMKSNVNGKFSTFDHDNDQYENSNCALTSGASWYTGCYGPYLNGRYKKTQGDEWGIMSLYGHSSLKSVRMLIRPKVSKSF